MKQRLAPYAKGLYRTFTPATKRGTLYTAPLSLGVFGFGMFFLGGITVGAGANLGGESISTVLSAVNSTRFELWMDFAREGTISRVLFGLLYPLIAGMFTALRAGVHLGYTVPQLGHVVNALSVLWPVAGLGLIALQFTRYVELRCE